MNKGETLRLLTNGHKYAISVVLSIPNDRLLSGSTDSNIVLWDVNTGNIIRFLIGHRNIILSFLLLPDGSLASSSSDNSIRIWNLDTGTTMRTNSVECMTLLNDGITLISGSVDWRIKLWNSKNAQLLGVISDHRNWVTSLVTLPDGRFASGSYSEIKIWNII